MFDLKEFIQDFKTGLTQDLEGSSSFTVNRQEKKDLDFLPVEIWETKEKYFIQTYLAAIKELSDVQISIKDDHTLVLKVYFSSNKPAETCWIVNTEYPNFLHREISFPHTIIEGSTTLQNGILTIDLKKQIWDLELPICSDKIPEKSI